LSIKNLTAEGAEHAEVRMAKGSGPGIQRKSSPFATPLQRPKAVKRFPGNDLCALCFLFILILVFLRGGFRERKIFIPQNEKRIQNRR
jgi:hypothetical protein